MDERLKFVARRLDGERRAPLCRKSGTSRKTGYKVFNRYKDVGLQGPKDRNRGLLGQAKGLSVSPPPLVLRTG